MKHLTKRLLIVAIALQAVILVGMLIRSAMPLWFGTEVRVSTLPVDPRSLFRGNYARLNYDFSRINIKSFDDAEAQTPRRQGEVVYVSLIKGKEGIYQAGKPSFTKPKEGLFIRGRVQNRSSWRKQLRINYGIEAYFAPKERALALEKQLRKSALAVLMIDAGGNARLKDIIAKDSQ